MKSGHYTVLRAKSPLRRNRAAEADYYAQRQAESEAQRPMPSRERGAAANAKREKKQARKAAGDVRRNQIAELIRDGLPRDEITRRLRCSPYTVEDVRADMLLGKFGGFE